MATIIVTHENNEMDEYDFDVEIKTITIGRRSTNDVCVPHLSVSGNHCKVTISDEGTMIEDLNSTNGTYINGRLISRQLLNDGDDIVIGKARLTFLQPEYSKPHETLAAGADLSSTGQVIDADPVSEEVDEQLSLAEKAALNMRPDPVSAAAGGSNSQVDQQESEFAGDYYEPDEQEIDAMINDQASGSSQDPLGSSSGAGASSGRIAEGMSQAGGVAAAGGVVAAGVGGVISSTTDGKSNEISHVLDDYDHPDASGAVIEIKNGAKSGQVLPIDKPVTTLGRPGIQIAAIMKKPEGYFLMHIESENSDDRPTLNNSMIGDDPVPLSSGDSLKVAGIDVEFMLS